MNNLDQIIVDLRAEKQQLLLQVDAYRKMEADISKEMGCSMSNWGEHSDWCGVHDRNPMECQSLQIMSMKRLLEESRKTVAQLSAAMNHLAPETGPIRRLVKENIDIARAYLDKFADMPKEEVCGAYLKTTTDGVSDKCQLPADHTIPCALKRVDPQQYCSCRTSTISNDVKRCSVCGGKVTR